MTMPMHPNDLSGSITCRAQLFCVFHKNLNKLLIYLDLFDTLLMFSLRKEINLMNTQKEKQNQLAVRRPVLLEAQNFLSKEIDEWSKMSDLDDSRFKVRPPVVFEPSEKEVA